MIFPDMPKRRHFWSQPQIDQLYQDAESILAEMQPAQMADDQTGQVSVDEWFARHFPDQVKPAPIHREPFDWRQDPVGIVKLCAFAAFMTIWAWYWHQFQ